MPALLSVVQASADERALTIGAYLVGVVVLLAIVAPLAWAAWRVRRQWMPEWEGAPARLVETVLALSGILLASLLTGSLGLYKPLFMVVVALLVAAAAWLATRHPLRDSANFRNSSGNSRNHGRGEPVWVKLVAIACVAAVAAAWAIPTLGALAAGLDRADSMWYHMPLAAHWVQTGSLVGVHHVDPIYFAAYYPENSAVFHSLGILSFTRDLLSPLVNLGFLALALLSAWCIGRPFRLPAAALIGGCLALAPEMLVEFQAGEALNDIVGVAFLMAAAAILVNASAASRPSSGGLSVHSNHNPPLDGGGRGLEVAPAALAVAGLAAGVAAGNKLSFIVPVAVMTVGIVWLAPRGRRLATLGWWLAPVLLTGLFWYARNLVLIGNPIPMMGSLGPLDLPAPPRDMELRPGFSVAHYATDFQVWADWFFPGLRRSLGLLWPLTLLLLVGASVAALSRKVEPALRVLGLAALVTAIAYVFTPLTAAGEEGEPIAFVWNLRYLAPALGLAFPMAVCLPWVRRTSDERAFAVITLAVLTMVTVASLIQWQHGHLKGAVATAVLVGGTGLALLWFDNRYGGRGGWRSVPRGWLAAGAAILALVVLAAGYAEQNHYLKNRYNNTSPTLKLAEALRWPRDLREANIAVAGIRGVYNQYPFFGTDLSNNVQWLGVEGPDGGWVRIADCATWREEVNAGGYDYVVTMYDPYLPAGLESTKEAEWMRADPAAKQIHRDGPVAIFAVTGELDPAACGDLPDLSPEELDGRSIKPGSTANNPSYTGEGGEY